MEGAAGNRSVQSTRPNGFQALFFQKTWSVMSLALFDFVKRVLEKGEVKPGSNEPMLVLIPKKEKPSSTKGFRPISLCIVCIKLATKMLVNRLKGAWRSIILSN